MSPTRRHRRGTRRRHRRRTFEARVPTRSSGGSVLCSATTEIQITTDRRPARGPIRGLSTWNQGKIGTHKQSIRIRRRNRCRCDRPRTVWVVQPCLVWCRRFGMFRWASTRGLLCAPGERQLIIKTVYCNYLPTTTGRVWTVYTRSLPVWQSGFLACSVTLGSTTTGMIG
jgi:hypothetical protein